jgi:hypothetical protein
VVNESAGGRFDDAGAWIPRLAPNASVAAERTSAATIATTVGRHQIIV